MHDTYYRLLADAHTYYRRQLSASWAPAYLRSRHVPEPHAQHGLGYAPANWRDLLTHLRRRGYSEDVLTNCGLFSPTKDGRLYDRLRDRVVFPITDSGNRVVAFIGRIHPNHNTNAPRWLNTDTSPIYRKRDHLLTPFARTPRPGTGAIVAEGPFDALAIARAIPAAAVYATCGTALSETQTQTLAHNGTPTVAVFDSDDAGIATMSRLRQLLPAARGVLLPPGHDPASFYEHNGAQLLADAIKAHRPIIEHELEQILTGHNEDTVEQRVHRMRDAIRLIATVEAHQQPPLARNVITTLGLAPDTVTEAFIPELAAANNEATRSRQSGARRDLLTQIPRMGFHNATRAA